MYGVDPLGPDAIKAVDSDGVLGEVLDLGEHLRDALWRVQSANIKPEPTPGGLIVVGVDGLERGGTLAAAALADEMTAPLTLSRGIPAPTEARATLLLASYSGDDAAVLEAFARAENVRPVVLTTGGQLAIVARRVGAPVIPLPGGFPQPVLAAGYPLVVCLELARLGSLAESSAAAVELAAAHVARLAREWGPDSPEDSGAKRLALAAVEERDFDWAPSPVEAGETPLQQAVSRLLLDNLVDLYTQVLRARSQP